MYTINLFADPGVSMIQCNVCITQLIGLLVIMMPRIPLQCLWGIKHFQLSVNLHLDYLAALLPSTVLQLSPRIFTVAMQQVPGSYTLVEVFLSVWSSSVGVTSPLYMKLRSHHHYFNFWPDHAWSACYGPAFCGKCYIALLPVGRDQY